MSRVKPINRRTLIGLLVLITTLPPLFVVSFFLLHEAAPEPKLDVAVELTVMRYSKSKSEGDERLLSAVRVINTSRGDYRNVSVSLNKQFFYYHPKPLAAGANMEIPLEFFVTKGGNVKFQTGYKKVEIVTVFGQLPTNARAVAEWSPPEGL